MFDLKSKLANWLIALGLLLIVLNSITLGINIAIMVYNLPYR